MKIISLQQGSQEWLDWRESKIAATDASIIMGLNPFKNVVTLWKEKLSIVAAPPANEHMRRGQELEPIARALFIEETGIDVEPLVIESDKYSWMGASLDGIDATRKIIVEIKCPSADTHLLAANGGIKPYYEAQMQHQLYASEAEICYYVSYNTGCDPKFVVLEITRNEEFIKEMIACEEKFYHDNLCGMKQPEGDWIM
jgi:putative phage-type endonuclease